MVSNTNPITMMCTLPLATIKYRPDVIQIPVTFISGQYLENVPEKPYPEALSWVDWLVKWCGILQYPELFTRDRISFSNDCCHLSKHREDKFVGFLRLHSGFRYYLVDIYAPS